MNINRLNKKLLTLGIVAIMLFLFLLIKQRNTTHTLTITGTPDNLVVEVDQKPVDNPSEILPGIHQISISKEGFVTDLRQVNISSDSVIEVNLSRLTEDLQTLPVTTKNVFQATEIIGSSTDFSIALNRENSKLIKIEGNQISTVYPNSVKLYAFNHPYLVATENMVPDKIIFVDLTNNSVKEIPVKNLGQIISLSLSLDGKEIVVLANYDPKTRGSLIKTINVNTGQVSDITSSKANKIDYLSNNKIVLFRNGEGPVVSEFVIFDISQKRVAYSEIIDSYVLSPKTTQALLLVGSKKFLLDTEGYIKKELSVPSQYKPIFKDEKNIVFLNNSDRGVEIYSMNINFLQPILIATDKNVSKVLSLLAISKNELLAISLEGKLVQIKLP